jgi:hypothetical protein
MVKKAVDPMEDRMHIPNYVHSACMSLPYDKYMGHGLQDQRSPTFSPCAAASKKAFFDRFPGASEALSYYNMTLENCFLWTAYIWNMHSVLYNYCQYKKWIDFMPKHMIIYWTYTGGI